MGMPNAEGREGRDAGTPVQRGSAGMGRRDEFMQVCPERGLRVLRWRSEANQLEVFAFKMPNVRVKPAPTAWRAGQQAQNGPQAQRLLAGAPRCWGSA